MSTLTLERVDAGAVTRVTPRGGSRDRARRDSLPQQSSAAIVRSATVADAPVIHELITADADGHLLGRTLSDLTRHANRFVVVTVHGRIVGCAELAPLSSSVAEVRSLVVRTNLRGGGLGRQLIDELRARARTHGFEQLCAFTHAPSYFARLGFASVPHTAVPEKIAADCRRCSLFGSCGQYAMVKELVPPAAFATPAGFLAVL